MLEFAFFHPKPSQLFVDFLDQHKIESFQSIEDESLILIKIAILEDDALLDKIETCYEELLEMNQMLFEKAANEDEFVVAGVVVNLNDGRSVYADIDTKILIKLMEALSSFELNDLINAVVDAVENPDKRSPCERRRVK